MTSSSRVWVLAGIVAIAAAVVVEPAAAGAVAPTASGVAATSRAAVTPSLVAAVPSWALRSAPVAAEPARARVDVAVLLRGRDEAGLRRLVAAVSDPASPSYRHFLSQGSYAARFAPSRAAADRVAGWLRAAGLTVDGVSPHHTLVYAHGPADVVGPAFRTRFAVFRHAGRLLRAPLAEPTVPAAVRPVVQAVAGLAQTGLSPTAPPAPAFVNARPCSHYYGQKIARRQPRYAGSHRPWAVCGYTPTQLRKAYGVNRVTSRGKGATVAIVDAFASPSVVHDANTWSRRHGLPAFRPGQLSQVLYPGASSLPEANLGNLVDIDPQGWQGEETLDVEAVHAMAPAARIVYYAATNVAAVDPGLYVALARAVEGGKVQVVSNSWGLPDDFPLPSDQVVFDTVANEAAAEGITLDFSTGDAGDEIANIGQRSADFPATSPQVTAVGGTTLRVGRTGRWRGETYWGTVKVPRVGHRWDFAARTSGGAGGGGNSFLYPEPSWQRRLVPHAEATANEAANGGPAAGRVTPDLSMDSDPTTGMVIGETVTFAGGKVGYAEYRIGGTSLACPLFSGLVALAVGQRHGKGVGLVAPTLYAKSRTAKGRHRLFHDPSGIRVSHGLSTTADVRPDYVDPANPSSRVVFSLRSLGNLGSLHRRRGYDDSTGLGSPRAPALVRALTR